MERYPLTWPTGRKRTPRSHRRASAFKPIGFGRIRDEMLHELELLGAMSIVLSTNVKLRGDGLPYASEKEPDDVGVAVYFERRASPTPKPYAIACDSYDRTWKNMRAIGHAIAALRTIERHGSTEMLEQAFTGFSALPPSPHAETAAWWEVLDVSRHAGLVDIDAAHQRLVILHHPDRGGDPVFMARVNAARDQAYEDRTR